MMITLEVLQVIDRDMKFSGFFLISHFDTRFVFGLDSLFRGRAEREVVLKFSRSKYNELIPNFLYIARCFITFTLSTSSIFLERQ
jgi:hypothetical protein